VRGLGRDPLLSGVRVAFERELKRHRSHKTKKTTLLFDFCFHRHATSDSWACDELLLMN